MATEINLKSNNQKPVSRSVRKEAAAGFNNGSRCAAASLRAPREINSNEDIVF